jgi:hypothetical protein
MKAIVFGNPHTDWWKLSLEDISTREQVVALNGELHVGFFVAATPMCVAPTVLSRFASDVRELDRTLAGSATLESSSQQSTVSLRLAVDHLGHVHATGRYEINGNGLAFTFGSDQTRLAPLAAWLEGLVQAYERKKP